MKITVLDTNTVTNGDLSLKPLEHFGEVSYYDMLSEDGIIENAKQSDIIICNKSVITERIMKNCKNLKFITLFATGYNNIDLKAAQKHGITVSNAPGYSTDSVAQHTFALILELAESLSSYTSSVKNGDWTRAEKFCYFSYPLSELSGKTLGIIGFGAIGRKVAEIAKAFSMKVLCNARSEKHAEGVTYCTKEEIFKNSDYITLHCPLNEETRGLISKETIALMKPTARIINTSRGAVIDEEALTRALNSGRIAGAAVDVLDHEPMQKGHPYLTAKNIIITPHIAWATDEARERLIQLVCENLEGFQNGRPVNTVSAD